MNKTHIYDQEGKLKVMIKPFFLIFLPSWTRFNVNDVDYEVMKKVQSVLETSDADNKSINE